MSKWEKRKIILISLAVLLLFLFWETDLDRELNQLYLELVDSDSRCEVPLLISSQDQNNNQIPDALDIVNGARQEVELGTHYDASYYQGGYPPEGKGACTDVIWRAFKAAGYDLKEMVDQDIENAPDAYGNTGENPDPDIDFRRVSNLEVFFQRHGQQLTLELIPGDIENLSCWQAGDIVVFAQPLEHIGIVSERRRRDGVPLLIHNAGPRACESDSLQGWPSRISYHFRFPAGEEVPEVPPSSP